VNEKPVVTTQSPRECVPLLPKRPFAVLELSEAVPIPEYTKDRVFIDKRRKPPKPLTEQKKFAPRSEITTGEKCPQACQQWFPVPNAKEAIDDGREGPAPHAKYRKQMVSYQILT